MDEFKSVTCDGYQFSFRGAKSAYKFDETDNLSPYFHGVNCFKAIDIVVEYPDYDVYIELKRHSYPLQDQRCEYCDTHSVSPVRWLKNNLIRKFRDTFLYRYCEKKMPQTIKYVCFFPNLQSPLLSRIKDHLVKELPVDGSVTRWKRVLISRGDVSVVDLNGFIRQNPDWSVTKLP